MLLLMLPISDEQAAAGSEKRGTAEAQNERGRAQEERGRGGAMKLKTRRPFCGFSATTNQNGRREKQRELLLILFLVLLIYAGPRRRRGGGPRRRKERGPTEAQKERESEKHEDLSTQTKKIKEGRTRDCFKRSLIYNSAFLHPASAPWFAETTKP